MTEFELVSLGSRVARALRREHTSWRCALGAAREEGLSALVELAARGVVLEASRHDAAQWDKLRRRAALAGVVMEEAAAAISSRLASAGIPHALLKGAAVAPLYGRAWARPMSDIDVLVGESGLAGSREALEPLGYVEALSSELETVLVPERGASPLCAVDLHRRLGYAGQFDFPVDEMLARARRRGRVQVLAPEDELLALAAHVACHRFRGVGRSLCDIAAVALVCPVDWRAVVERARSWRVSAAAWAAFSCARRSFGAPVPRDVISRLRPGLAQEAYLRLWLDLGSVSPWRLSSRGYGALARRAALVILWPALSDGLLRGTAFATCYSLRMLTKYLAMALRRGGGS